MKSPVGKTAAFGLATVLTAKKKPLADLALLAAALLLCAGTVELAARVWASRASEVEAEEPLHRHDPDLGWVKVPGAVAQLERDEFSVTIEVNANGQRGPLRSYEKPPGVRRVLLLGDSFAAGYYVEELESIRAVLEERLAPCDAGRVEVLTAGTGGYSTDQEYLEFVGHSRRYAPDVVVLLLFSNDLLFNTQAIGTAGQPKPVFGFWDGELTLGNTPVPERVAESPRPAKPWRGSMALRLLSRRTARGNPKLHRSLEGFGLVAPLPRDPPREYLVYGPPRFAEQVEPMWRVTEAIVERLAAAVELEGARFGILYVPAHFETSDAAWAATSERYNMGPRWRPGAVIERLEAVGARLGIPLLDPTRALADSEALGRPAYYRHDGHWNVVGHATAARALAPFVARQLGCAL